jgi:type III secretory pathway component EscV
MTFNRPPRIQKPLPKDKIDIPTPINLPSKPGPLDRITIFLSFGAIILTIVFVMLVSGGGSAGFGYLIFLPLMLVSYVGTWFTSRNAKKKYEQDLAQAKQEYDEALNNAERSLQDLQGRQRQIMLEVDPELNECLRRVNAQDPRLGERRPGLSSSSIRIGYG